MYGRKSYIYIYYYTPGTRADTSLGPLTARYNTRRRPLLLLCFRFLIHADSYVYIRYGGIAVSYITPPIIITCIGTGRRKIMLRSGVGSVFVKNIIYKSTYMCVCVCVQVIVTALVYRAYNNIIRRRFLQRRKYLRGTRPV